MRLLDNLLTVATAALGIVTAGFDGRAPTIGLAAVVCCMTIQIICLRFIGPTVR